MRVRVARIARKEFASWPTDCSVNRCALVASFREQTSDAPASDSSRVTCAARATSGRTRRQFCFAAKPAALPRLARRAARYRLDDLRARCPTGRGRLQSPGEATARRLAARDAWTSSKARVADSEERALARLRMQALPAWALTEAPPHHCPGGFRPCPDACPAAPGVVLAHWSRTGPRIRRDKPRRAWPNAGSRDVRVRCILGGTTGAGLASRRVQRSPPIGPGSTDL
jgi:hypothetical protein